MAFGYNYGGYPANGYYSPPMPDQLAQLRNSQYNPGMMQQNPMMGAQNMNQMPNMQQVGQPMQMSGNGILWVSSEREALEYPLAINSAVALWDSNNPVIYLKQSDSSGKPSMKIYDLVERDTGAATASKAVPNVNADYVTRREFEALQARFDALITSSVQSQKSQSKSKNNQKTEEETE